MKIYLAYLAIAMSSIAMAMPTVAIAKSNPTNTTRESPTTKTLVERNLATPTLDRRVLSQYRLRRIDNTKEMPMTNDLISQSKRKSRKPVSRQKPQSINTTPAQEPSEETPSANTEPQVIIAEIEISTDRGQLEPALESKIRQVLTVKIGQSVTRTQLEQNLNAVKALGNFSTVEIVPKDTAKGVKISFLVKPTAPSIKSRLRRYQPIVVAS